MPKGSKHKKKKSERNSAGVTLTPTTGSQLFSQQFHLEQTPSNQMPKPKRNPSLRRRMRINRRVNSRVPAAFRSVRLQVKNVFTYADADPRQWTYPLSLSHLVEKYTMYDEFKCVNVRCIIRPYDSNQTAGLRASLILDKDGFGAYPKGTHQRIFTMVCETPGAKISPAYRPTTHVWRPTGPSSREWRKATDAFTIMRLYFINS